jgi:D-hydroxyproline dehydrogenase subunit beta
MIRNSADIGIVGGGIVGLAHAYHALKKGYRVVMFERDEYPVGASIRNFGLIWPIGQFPGEDWARAMRSRRHWIDIAHEAGIWLNPNGSLHLAYEQDELGVLDEFYQLYRQADSDLSLVGKAKVLACSPVVKSDGLKGGLISGTEMTVNPRDAIGKITSYLQEKFGMVLCRGTVVTGISLPVLHTSRGEWLVSKVFVCSGADFETLYPEAFGHSLSKCKLQMMKGRARTSLSIGPTLCGGLTLRHYKSFSQCATLGQLSTRLDAEDIRWARNGIHVMLAQNHEGDLIIGDSHHYGRSFEPFDSEEVAKLILSYLARFANIEGMEIVERWHGVYSKINDDVAFINEVEPDVTIVTALGGAGMTLSFGLAEDIISKI